MDKEFLGKVAKLEVNAQLVRTETKNVLVRVATVVNGTGIWTAIDPYAAIIGDGKAVTRLCVFALDDEHTAKLTITGPNGRVQHIL